MSLILAKKRFVSLLNVFFQNLFLVVSYKMTTMLTMHMNRFGFFAGTAYIHGMQHARGNFIIIMDADLSHHVSLSKDDQ